MAGEGGAGERVQVIQSSNTIYNIYNTTRHSSSLTKVKSFYTTGRSSTSTRRYWTGTCHVSGVTDLFVCGWPFAFWHFVL